MAVKVFIDQQIADAVPGTVVQQQAAQHAGFAFNGMGRDAELGYLPVGAVARVVKRRKYGRHEFPEKTAMLKAESPNTLG
jgi:hypothetical protein